MGQDAVPSGFGDPNRRREEIYNMVLKNLMAIDGTNCKRAKKEHVFSYSIFVTRNVPAKCASVANLTTHTFVITDHAPKKWFLMTRFRNDRDWRLIITPDVPGTASHFLSLADSVLITSRRITVSPPTVLEFFLQAVSELSLEENKIIESACDFFYRLDPDPAYIKDLFEALKTEYFPVEKENVSYVTLSSPPPYTILQAVHQSQLSAISALMESYDARANQDGRQQDWTSIMRGKQDVFVAYTYEGMKHAAITGDYPQIAGYLAASRLVSESPRLISLVVIPDERRNGLATMLLKRYFAQTSARELICSVPKLLKLGDRQQEAYHVAALLKKMGGRIDRDSLSTWRFILPNPHEKLQK